MNNDLIKWDVYEISVKNASLTGVKLRGRIRKYGVKNKINILAENTTDVSERVRIAVFEGTDISNLSGFIKGIIPDSNIELKLKGVKNPVLSKLKVNDGSRYKI
jgi:hypothetical protein